MATFFLNLFFGGKLKTMPPKLVSDDGRHVVIRPLAYVRERDLAAYAALKQFPLIPCTLCGSQENLQRKQIALMLREWERKFPGRIESIFNALRQGRADAPSRPHAAGLRRRARHRPPRSGRRHRFRRRPAAGGRPAAAAPTLDKLKSPKEKDEVLTAVSGLKKASSKSPDAIALANVRGATAATY